MSKPHLLLRRVLPLASSLIMLFASLALPVTAQEDPRALDPSDVFFQAWLTVRDAEKLEKSGKFNDARLKYQQAAKYYQVISKYHRNWKPHLVEARVKSTREALTNIESKAMDEIAKQNAKAEGLVEGGPATAPDAGEPTGTGHQMTPKPTATSPNTSKVANYSEAIVRGQQRQLETLQRENRRLQERLKQSQKAGKLSESAEQKRLINMIADKDREIAQIRNILAKAPLQADMDLLKKKNRKLTMEIDITALSLKGTRERLAEEQKKRQKAEEEAQFAQRRAEQIQKTMETQKKADNRVVRELRKELKNVTQVLEKTRHELGIANARITRMQRTLDQSKSTIDELTKERDALRTERDTLANILKQNDTEGVRKLISENMRLGKELKESNDRLQYLTKKNNVTQDELLEAKRDLAIAKTRIMRYQQERTRHSTRIQSLESQLRDAEAALADAKSNPDKSANQEEVEILKDTVKRLIAAQDRRNAAEKILWDTYQDSKKIIPGIVEAFEDVRKTKVELTEEEKGLMVKRIPDGEFTVPQRVTPEHARASANAMERDISDHNRIVKRLFIKGRYEAARQILADMDERFPGHFPTLCNRGVVELKTDRFIEAGEIFSEAITMRENSSYAHYMLGLSHYHNQDFDSARNSFQHALDLKPGDAKAHFYLGTLAGVGRRYEQAETHLKEAIQLNPTMADAHFNLSFLYLRQNRKNDAIKYYRSALQHGSQPAPEHERKLGLSN